MTIDKLVKRHTFLFLGYQRHGTLKRNRLRQRLIDEGPKPVQRDVDRAMLYYILIVISYTIMYVQCTWYNAVRKQSWLRNIRAQTSIVNEQTTIFFLLCKNDGEFSTADHQFLVAEKHHQMTTSRSLTLDTQYNFTRNRQRQSR